MHKLRLSKVSCLKLKFGLSELPSIDRWKAVGLSTAQWCWLQDTHFVITDLDASRQLANSRPGVIEVDDNAAGFGWFVDLTPDGDEEFLQPNGINTLRATTGGAADGKLDLFTVALHELGHILGLDHSDDPDDLLFESLAAGQRKRISARDVDQLFNLLGR